MTEDRLVLYVEGAAERDLEQPHTSTGPPKAYVPSPNPSIDKNYHVEKAFLLIELNKIMKSKTSTFLRRTIFQVTTQDEFGPHGRTHQLLPTMKTLPKKLFG